MNFKYLAFISFSLFLLQNASGQQLLAIKGVISKKLSVERVPQAFITNLRTHDAFMSDELGWFTVKAAIGDTLLFSKADFTDQKIAITSPHDIPVYMQPVIKLAQVTIQGQTKKQELADVMADYRKQGTFYNGKPPVLSFLTSPIAGLYELFGATPGRARRFAAFSKGETEYAEVHRRYNVPLIKRVTGATDTVAKQFMEYYTPSYEDLKGWNDYELIKRIKKSYAYYDKAQNKNQLQHLNAPAFIKSKKDTVSLFKK